MHSFTTLPQTNSSMNSLFICDALINAFTISRTTAIANPRQIERVTRGAKFDLDIIYEATKEDEIVEDMALLAEGMKLLQYDYIGGHGSRGYGKIKFTDVIVEVAIGDIDDEIMQQVEKIFTDFSD